MHSEQYVRLLKTTLMQRVEEKVDEMIDLHVKKSAGYAGKDNLDPWQNFRTSTDFGVEPWRGAMVRLGDKFTRLSNIVQNGDNDQIGEGIESEGMDLAAYAVIISVLWSEDPGLPENRTDGFTLGGSRPQDIQAETWNESQREERIVAGLTPPYTYENLHPSKEQFTKARGRA